MLRLNNGSTQLISLITAQDGANVVVNFSDKTTTAYTGDSQVTNITTATTTTICATPAASTIRDIDHITIRNTFAGSHAVTVQMSSSATLYPLIAVTLASGDCLEWTHAAGWRVVDLNGSIKTIQNGAELQVNKDASDGYVGKTLEKINIWNAARTFLSSIVSLATAARTRTFPDKDMTVAGLDDITGGTVAASFTTINIGAASGTYSAGTEKVKIGSPSNTFGPILGTSNRTYLHYIGVGGTSAYNIGLQGYQIGNPASPNWVRVAPGLTNGSVSFLTFSFSDGLKVVTDTAKTTGDPDYTPTTRFSVTPLGALTAVTISASVGYHFTNLISSVTAPTIASGFGTSPAIAANGTATFRVTIGSGGTASTGALTMPAAATGWNVTGVKVFNPTATNMLQNTDMTAMTTTSITLTNYTTSSGAAEAWPAGTVLMISATAY